ncbi:WD40 repeat-like protein [Gyrodon lividus]|nr:WD40 repeat-like protein [Gyrodon lividus]
MATIGAAGAPTPSTSQSLRPIEFSGHTSNVRSTAFLQDGKRALSASWDGSVRMWDIENRCALGEPIVQHDNYMLSVVVSPDGKLIASGGGTRVFISDAEDGHLVMELNSVHKSWVNCVCFSPDGKALATCSDDRTVAVWDVATGTNLVPPFQAHFSQVRWVSYSPDGQRLLTASNDNTIQVWDVSTRRPVEPGFTQPITGHQYGITCAIWSHGGDQIISSSMDGTIGFWHSKTGEQIGDFCRGHTAAIWSISLAPGGEYLSSASFDGTVRLWDVTTHAQIGPPLEHGDEIYSATFSPDGLAIISGGHAREGRIFLWDVRSLIQGHVTTQQRSVSPLSHPAQHVEVPIVPRPKKGRSCLCFWR